MSSGAFTVRILAKFVAVTVAGAWGLHMYQTMKENNNTSTITNKLPDFKKKDDLAKDYLQNLAKSGDELAKRALQSSPNSSSPALVMPIVNQPSEEFRFDVSKEGLIGALTKLLEAKRSFEQSIHQQYRKTGKYPANYKETLTNIQQDKAEIKKLIKSFQQ